MCVIVNTRCLYSFNNNAQSTQKLKKNIFETFINKNSIQNSTRFHDLFFELEILKL